MKYCGCVSDDNCNNVPGKHIRYIRGYLGGWDGRNYIERLSESDRKNRINSFGKLEQQNSYGLVLAQYDDGEQYPVICGHGGSMWLCRECADKLVD